MINPCALKVPSTRKLRAPEFGKTAHGSVAAMSPLKCPPNPQALGGNLKVKLNRQLPDPRIGSAFYFPKPSKRTGTVEDVAVYRKIVIELCRAECVKWTKCEKP
jgi:hypothetical protein